MHQLTDKKNKIIIYLLFLFILSTTSGKFKENQNSHSFKINQINIKGLSGTDNAKIYKELSDIFYKNILLVSKDELVRIHAYIRMKVNKRKRNKVYSDSI